MDESRKRRNSKFAEKRHMERSADHRRQDSNFTGYLVFLRKRTPDGTISKYKARFCVRGDLQETVQETFAPVVAWSTVRLFLILSLTLCWKTCTIDFSSAFVQALLSDPVWIHLPLYLSTKTRPDIAFAVSQVARFCHCPKKSHASAVKTLVRYLHRTSEMGMIVQPKGNLDLDCYVNADFAGLHGRDPDRSPTSAKSRTGYIITLGGCPILWNSHLQSEIYLSTLEAEYSALSSAIRTLLPLHSMLLVVVSGVKLPYTFTSTIKCQVFEDNNGALLLAVNQRITNRMKYFQVKWHFFWQHVRDGTVAIV
jgi:hypothetical protein